MEEEEKNRGRNIWKVEEGGGRGLGREGESKMEGERGGSKMEGGEEGTEKGWRTSNRWALMEIEEDEEGEGLERWDEGVAKTRV